MVKFCKTTFINLLFILFISSLNAQTPSGSVAIGLGGAALWGNTTEFGISEQPNPQMYGFIRHLIWGPLEGQLNGGFLGKLTGDSSSSFSTNITSGDYRVLLRPVSLEYFSTYLYGGFGAIYRKIQQSPANPSPNLRSKKWEMFIPAGIGIQINMNDALSFDINGGYNFALTDALDLKVDDKSQQDGYFNLSIGFTYSFSRGMRDHDIDGLSQKEEEMIGTNKNLADTDGDGLNDGAEYLRHKTDPLKADTDGDDINDAKEILTYNTDPMNFDSDSDGLGDAEEIRKYKTNPLEQDSDFDKIHDKDEITVFKTDPNNPDMDNDGLSDGIELMEYKTDPKNADSDQDGLKDKEEITLYTTDPLKSDSDGGNVPDGIEIQRGTNPLDAKDDGILSVQKIGDRIILEGLTFQSGQAALSIQGMQILDKAYRTMLTYQEMIVEVRGYTDNTGSRKYNLHLSQKRAEAVKDYLVEQGINPSRIIARGFGPDSPIVPNHSFKGRAKNRRIEFIRIQ